MEVKPATTPKLGGRLELAYGQTGITSVVNREIASAQAQATQFRDACGNTYGRTGYLAMQFTIESDRFAGCAGELSV